MGIARTCVCLVLAAVLLAPTGASARGSSADAVRGGVAPATPAALAAAGTKSKLFTKRFKFRTNVWLERNGVRRCARFAYRAKLRVRVKRVKSSGIIGYYYHWEKPRVVDPKIRMVLFKGNASKLRHNRWCPHKNKPRRRSKGAFIKGSLWGGAKVCKINSSVGASWPAGVSVGFTPECGKSTKYWRIDKRAHNRSTAYSLVRTGRYGVWSYGSTFFNPNTKVCLKARFYGQVNRPRSDAHSAGFKRKRTVCLPVGKWGYTLSPY